MKEWGDYRRGPNSEYLGYPRENLLSRWNREGAGASQPTAQVIPDPPRDYDKVTRVVLSMQSPVQMAIRCRYEDGQTNVNGAHKCRCSEAEFQKRVQRGIDYTAGAFTFAN